MYPYIVHVYVHLVCAFCLVLLYHTSMFSCNLIGQYEVYKSLIHLTQLITPPTEHSTCCVGLSACVTAIEIGLEVSQEHC